MRAFAFLIILSIFPLVANAILVNTRLHSITPMFVTDTITIDLKEYFQLYEGEGPIASFTISMPREAGAEDLFVAYQTQPPYIGNNPGVPITDDDGKIVPRVEPIGDETTAPTLNLMTYELQSGESYNSPWSVFASEMVWETKTVDFQLLPEDAPITVANYMTYIRDGKYTRTNIHRVVNQTATKLIQAGGFTVLEEFEWAPLASIETIDPIPLEAGLGHERGSIAAARGSASNSAQSQFFINLTGNSGNSAGMGNNWQESYAVFGRHASGDLEILDRVLGTIIYNFNDASGPSIWQGSGVFTSVPQITPYGQIEPWDLESWIYFDEVTVTEGNTSGISYDWAPVPPVDDDPDDDVEPKDSNTPDSFEIQISEDGIMTINSTDNGELHLEVTGTAGDETVSFEMIVYRLSLRILDFFGPVEYGGSSWVETTWYEWVFAKHAPYIFSYGHNYQYIPETASDTESRYIYDYSLGWWYTTPSYYPFIYLYGYDRWLYYEIGSTYKVGEEDEGRWFQDPETKEYISEKQLLNGTY